MTASPATVRAAAAALGSAAPPMVGGEPVFAEPWEGRAYGLALDLVERLGLRWDVFRGRLIAAIDAEPTRPYFESWVVALEDLATSSGVIPDDLHHERLESASYHYVEDGTPIEVAPLAMPAAVLATVLDAPFGDPTHTQTELYCRANSECGVRAFDGSGAVVATRPMPADAWVSLRDRLFAVTSS